MNRFAKEKRTQIASGLVEGNSLCAFSRMSDVAFNTVLKLVPEIGRVCADYRGKALRNLTCKGIQCDRQWQQVQVTMFGMSKKLSRCSTKERKLQLMLESNLVRRREV
jgi:hypothetical protein